MSKNTADKENSLKTKTIKFFSRKGFYIVLFLCLCVVGAATMFINKSDMEYLSYQDSEEVEVDYENREETEVVEDETEDVPVIAKLEVENQKLDSNDKNTDTVNEEKLDNEIILIESKPDVGTEATPNKNEVESVENIEKQVEEEFLPIYPVQGEIILEFTKDKLVYLNTLNRWGTHKGIDIKTDLGTPVKASARGVIEKIYDDDGYGITIVIDHRNGYKTAYSNLSIDNMVKEKQSVEQGDVISGIGDTAIFEIADPPHLHFEIIKDGKHINPQKYLPN